MLIVLTGWCCHSCMILYDMRALQYGKVNKSTIDIAVSPNWYSHYITSLTGPERGSWESTVLNLEFPIRSFNIPTHMTMWRCMPACWFDAWQTLSTHAWPVWPVHGSYWPYSNAIDCVYRVNSKSKFVWNGSHCSCLQYGGNRSTCIEISADERITPCCQVRYHK